jgi:hypothetical protein
MVTFYAVAGHCQLHAALSNTEGTCLVWNYDEVKAVLAKHDCVIGCVFGHDHDGSFTTDPNVVHQLVVNGVIETPPGTLAYATVFLRNGSLDIEGVGPVPSVSFPLRYLVDVECNGGVSTGQEVLCVA